MTIKETILKICSQFGQPVKTSQSQSDKAVFTNLIFYLLFLPPPFFTLCFHHAVHKGKLLHD